MPKRYRRQDATHVVFSFSHAFRGRMFDFGGGRCLEDLYDKHFDPDFVEFKINNFIWKVEKINILFPLIYSDIDSKYPKM